MRYYGVSIRHDPCDAHGWSHVEFASFVCFIVECCDPRA